MFYLFFLIQFILSLISIYLFNQLKKYQYLANHDSLTGLLNRSEIENQLIKRMKYVKKNPDTCILYYLIDIDNFKQINDSKGHSYGDKVLKIVSNVLLLSIRTNHSNKIKFDLLRNDIIGRIGGDEFIIILLIKKNQKHTISNIIRNRIYETLDCCTLSIGLSTFTSVNKINMEDILNKADKKLYQAKNNGKGQLC